MPIRLKGPGGDEHKHSAEGHEVESSAVEASSAEMIPKKAEMQLDEKPAEKKIESRETEKSEPNLLIVLFNIIHNSVVISLDLDIIVDRLDRYEESRMKHRFQDQELSRAEQENLNKIDEFRLDVLRRMALIKKIFAGNGFKNLLDEEEIAPNSPLRGLVKLLERFKIITKILEHIEQKIEDFDEDMRNQMRAEINQIKAIIASTRRSEMLKNYEVHPGNKIIY